ncbi:hypothetical protein DY000_02002389 [Brassica cretica]|uniref:Uncharacterized protein n=1 Tax=Brassica cretica TaxID=69181 RepID=A0ABQ7C7R2_BRACR|nr:hypothetical protein DY000_02002389 [Brassica cretica]
MTETLVVEQVGPRGRCPTNGKATTFERKLAAGHVGASTPSERHASQPPRLDRLRFESPPKPHHRNFISSKLRTRRTSAETISVLPTLCTHRRASSLFDISSDKAKAPTLERQTITTRSIIETQTLRTATKYLKPATQSCGSLHPSETRADNGETEETSTSRRQEPAATELWEPPPPGIGTQTTSVFTAP